MSYALDVKLENTVRAFLAGFLNPVKSPSTELALLDMQSVDQHTQVLIGTYHVLSTDIDLRSDVRSACALQGVKAQDILDALLKMRLEVDGNSYPVVTVDRKTAMTSPAVCSLEAVYIACKYVLQMNVLRDYKLLVQAKQLKSKSK